MIFDDLKHIDNYKGLGTVYKALEFLAETDFTHHELGRFPLFDGCYYMVQRYDTDIKHVAECHEKYIDIQLLLQGREIIGVAPLDCEKVLAEARPANDVWFYTCQTEPLTLLPGFFMVLYPNDLHMPGATLDAPVACHKVVVKVPVAL